MSSHLPFDVDFSLYQQYSNFTYFPLHPEGTPIYQFQDTPDTSSTMSTNPQSPPQDQNQANAGRLLMPTPGRPQNTRTVSYQPPSTTVAWGEHDQDPSQAFESTRSSRGLDMFGVASYPPYPSNPQYQSPTRQRHTSFPGTMSDLSAHRMASQQPTLHYQTELFTDNYQFAPPPTQPLQTVQPSSIFKESFSEALYAQASLDTPDASARATPFDDGRYPLERNVSNSGSVQGWHSSAPNTDSLPSIQTLHIRQYSNNSSMGHLSQDSPTSEFDELAEEEGMTSTIPKGPGDGQNGEKKKRTRTPQACEACRKRKAKVIAIHHQTY